MNIKILIWIIIIFYYFEYIFKILKLKEKNKKFNVSYNKIYDNNKMNYI